MSMGMNGGRFAVGLFFFRWLLQQAGLVCKSRESSLCLQPAPHLRLCAVCCASAPLLTLIFFFFFSCVAYSSTRHDSSDETGPELQFETQTAT